MRTHPLTGILMIGAAASACAASADVVQLIAVADATLYEDASGAVADGAGPHLFAGYTLRNSSRFRRVLLRFDVSSIPSDARILDVSLRLYMSRSIAGDVPVTLHRAERGWSEGPTIAEGSGGGGGVARAGDATWRHALHPSVPWTAPGGDYSEDPAATLDVGGEGFYTWTSNELLVDLVDSWKRFPSQNFGMLVRGDEGVAGSVKRFESRENPDPTRRPVLIVEFARCPADFNQDGGVDGGDVADFFGAWSEGAAPADVNLDGGVDGSDVEAFFAPWEAGGC